MKDKGIKNFKTNFDAISTVSTEEGTADVGRREKACAYWLTCVPGIGNRTIHKLLRECGTAEAVYGEGEKLWKQFLTERQLEAIRQYRVAVKPEEGLEELEKTDIKFVRENEEEYPKRLRDIPDNPYAIFVKGRMPAEEELAVAVVGARECSEYGRYVATKLGDALGSCGIQVISGMARGIDGISQQAALDAGGMSFGVLGSGVDICYPKENRAIYERLCAQGGILSIYPPGTEARPQNFPPRNRVVSGLADVLVVVEARSKSGTLITVDMALEQGREVYVVPGRVTDRLSDGCNKLLKQGAGVFLSPDDFINEIASLRADKICFGGKEISSGSGKVLEIGTALRLEQLSPELRELYALLDVRPKSLEKLQEETGQAYPAARLTALLMRLCMEGLAIQLTPGHFSLKL